MYGGQFPLLIQASIWLVLAQENLASSQNAKDSEPWTIVHGLKGKIGQKPCVIELLFKIHRGRP